MLSGGIVTARRVATLALVLVLAARAAAQDDTSGDAAGSSAGDASGSAAAPAPAAEAEPAKKSAPAAKKPAASSKSKSKSKAKAAPKGISVSAITPIGSTVEVSDKILTECQIQRMLASAIAERNPAVFLADGGGAMRLDLRIVDVRAPSGGMFSGPKSITVEGRLLSGKTLKGRFIAKESSMAAATACGMLGKAINELAADIAVWLQSPTPNAYLGKAR